MNDAQMSFDVPGIMECQKNRYPMLFLDRVTECVPGKSATGFKLFSYNEWFFHGYETEAPKVWNAIQIEAMSQLFLMTFLSEKEFRGEITMSNKFDEVQFLRKIEPGDRLDLVAQLNSFGRGVARGTVVGTVNGETACSMKCTIIVPKLFGTALIEPKKITNSVYSAPKSQNDGNVNFGVEQIRECLLNKYPWLFLDRVIDLQPGKSVTAIKNFTYDEPFFPEHFPGDPIVPGFIQIEACMQSFLMAFLSIEKYKRKETVGRSLNNVLVKRKIVPGDTLVMHANLDFFSRGIAKGSVKSFVDNEPAVSFDVTAVITEELEKFRPKPRS